MNKIITILVGILTALSFYFYYGYNNAKLEYLANEVVIAEEKHEKANSIIEELQTKNTRQNKELDTLYIENSKARVRTKELEITLSKHDLKYLALQKPVLIQNIINKASKDVIRELEEITSHEVNEVNEVINE